jgi:hypothetical protein
MVELMTSESVKKEKNVATLTNELASHLTEFQKNYDSHLETKKTEEPIKYKKSSVPISNHCDSYCDSCDTCDISWGPG